MPHENRRADVARRADDRSLLKRCEDMAASIGKLIGIVTLSTACIAWVSTLVGVKISGPPTAIAVVTQRQDSLAIRVGRLEGGADSVRRQLGGIKYDVKFLSYLLCMKDRGSDQVALDRCQPIIASVQSGVAP